MPASRFPRPSSSDPRRWAPWLFLSSTACLSQSYEIGAAELQRIVALAPEERGDHLRVTQQTAFGTEIEFVPSELDRANLALWLARDPKEQQPRLVRRDTADDDESSEQQRRRLPRDTDDDSSPPIDTDDDDSAEAALGVAFVAVAAAATAAVTVGVTEGARFDGWVRAPVDHPVVLFDDRGARRWARLETLTPESIDGIDRAVLPDYAGRLVQDGRHPLDRVGFVYQLELGGESAAFEDAGLAFSARGAVGYMPSQSFGFLIGAAFASADTNELQPRESDTRLSFDHRFFAQAEAWPLALGPLHLGPYAELGYAWARADTGLGTYFSEGWTLGAGAALQLEWTTRLALTLRAGVARLPSVEPAELASNGYRLAPALTLGFSIY